MPGVLKAFIRYETAPRHFGTPLFEKDTVRLIATFDERLNRSIPEFNPQGMDIFVQYPLELSPPRCLDCVAKGDNVRFNWTVRCLFLGSSCDAHRSFPNCKAVYSAARTEDTDNFGS